MLVYRIASKEEIQIILNNRIFDNIGRIYKPFELVSTHQYGLKENYMHFFKEKLSFVQLEHKDKYLCIYDFDEYFLNNYEGIGIYNRNENEGSGYKIIEYAIPSRLVSFDNLVCFLYIANNISMDNLKSENILDIVDESLVLKYVRK